MSPELELLDQLLGDSMPLRVILRVLPGTEKAQEIITKSILAGHVRAFEIGGDTLPMWRWNELVRDPETWEAALDQIRLELTDAGVKIIG